MVKLTDYVERKIKMDQKAWLKFDEIKRQVQGRGNKNPDAQTLRRLMYLWDDNQYKRY